MDYPTDCKAPSKVHRIQASRWLYSRKGWRQFRRPACP